MTRITANTKRRSRRFPRRKRGWAVLGLAAILVWFVIAVLQPMEKLRTVATMQDPAATVVFVTMDGLRLSDLLNGTDPVLDADQPGAPVMANLMDKLVPQGVFLGDASNGSRVRLGNPMGISMSGYQAMFSGRFKLCVSNQCSPLPGDSLLTSVAEAFGPTTAFLSGYDEVCSGVTAKSSAAIAACGPGELADYAKTQDIQAFPPKDGIVVEAGLRVLQNNPPKLVYLGLEESDGAGHSGNYKNYLSVLSRYDGYLGRIWTQVEALNAAGHPTTLVVTVDHGRGRGENWTGHRWNISGTNDIWMFAAGHGVVPRGVMENTKTRSLYDIRPTIEHLLGMPHKTRVWGNVIAELFAKD